MQHAVRFASRRRCQGVRDATGDRRRAWGREDGAHDDDRCVLLEEAPRQHQVLRRHVVRGHQRPEAAAERRHAEVLLLAPRAQRAKDRGPDALARRPGLGAALPEALLREEDEQDDAEEEQRERLALQLQHLA